MNKNKPWAEHWFLNLYLGTVQSYRSGTAILFSMFFLFGIACDNIRLCAGLGVSMCVCVRVCVTTAWTLHILHLKTVYERLQDVVWERLEFVGHVC